MREYNLWQITLVSTNIFVLQMDDDNNSDNNPWAVESIMAFNYFVCPECSFQAKSPPSFENHALENHPRAKKLFDQNVDTVKMSPPVKSEHDAAMEELLKSTLINAEVKDEPNSYYFDIGMEEEEEEEDYNNKTEIEDFEKNDKIIPYFEQAEEVIDDQEGM